MIAGATGIDLFLLVIDAQEGARPQTLEHLAVLRLLGVERGVVAVTKADAVDEETLELALDEAHELVPGARGRRRVSAKTGSRPRRAARGARSDAVSSATPSRDAALRRPRVHAAGHRHDRDRDALVGHDRRRRRSARRAAAAATVRVRSVQVHDAPVERAEAGQRVAVNLPRSSDATWRAATCSSSRATIPSSYRLDVALEELEPIPAAVTVHLGTKAVAGARGSRRRPTRSCGSSEPRRRGARRPRRAAHRHDRRRRRRARPGAATRARHRATRAARSRRPGGDRPLARARARSRATPCSRAGCSLRPSSRSGSRCCRPSRRLLLLGSVARPSCARRTRATRSDRLRESPLEPGVPLAELLPNEPWAPAVAEPARHRAPRCEGVPSRCDRRARRARRGGRRTRGAARGRGDREASTTAQLAAFLEDEGRLRRVGDGYAVSTELYDRGLSSCFRRSTRSRSRRSATHSASGGAPRSSCSSATTRTA